MVLREKINIIQIYKKLQGVFNEGREYNERSCLRQSGIQDWKRLGSMGKYGKDIYITEMSKEC